MILTTVLDETWRGRTGLRFADDPHLVNVAVSRAIRRFVLVTNNDMMPTSRYFRDLVDYIRYQTPGAEVAESAVVSVFDLLYRDYSARLAPLAARVRNETRYRSEDIVWTVIQDILVEERYAHLSPVRQVLLRNLLPGLDGLTPQQEAYVRHRASVDFVVYNRVSNRPVLAGVDMIWTASRSLRPRSVPRGRTAACPATTSSSPPSCRRGSPARRTARWSRACAASAPFTSTCGSSTGHRRTPTGAPRCGRSSSRPATRV
jgi:hypothetical protein